MKSNEGSGPGAPWDEVQRRYGVDARNPSEASYGRKLWNWVCWVFPALILGLWWEAVPESLPHPYKPAELISWGFIGVNILILAAYRLIMLYERYKQPKSYWQDTFRVRSRSRRSRWMNWYNGIVGAAFVVTAVWTDRAYLAFAMAFLISAVWIEFYLENRRVKGKLESLARGENGDAKSS